MIAPLLSSFLLLLYFGISSLERVEIVEDTPVLVELFTSQGCSSCPPADRVLANLVKDDQLNVVALSFHVDYWNRLGWKDPYSQAAFTERQYAYAEQLINSRRVYTPQMIVHGQSGHIGSREKEVRISIQKAARTKPHIYFDLSVQKHGADQLELLFVPSAATEAYDLVVCLVDGSLENAVPRGENKGRNLAHVQVVQTLQTLSAQQKQVIVLDLDQLDNPEQGQVVAFLQHKKNRQIGGVQKLVLKSVKIQP